MRSYVLVPGAWIGGWAWQAVARRLREAGHDVYPVTLTGLGDRVHLARREVDLETHISDVINLLEYEDLRRDVVLVVHSYAGSVGAAVADRAGDRLSHAVYVDTAPLEDGQSQLDFHGPEESAELRRKVAERGEGWRLPFPGFEGLGPPSLLEGIGPRERALLEAKSTPQPFGTYEQKLRLRGARASYQPVAIACGGFRMLEQLAPAMMKFMTPAWQRLDLETGHWPMLSAPDRLAELLSGLGR